MPLFGVFVTLLLWENWRSRPLSRRRPHCHRLRPLRSSGRSPRGPGWPSRAGSQSAEPGGRCSEGGGSGAPGSCLEGVQAHRPGLQRGGQLIQQQTSQLTPSLLLLQEWMCVCFTVTLERNETRYEGHLLDSDQCSRDPSVLGQSQPQSCGLIQGYPAGIQGGSAKKKAS